MPDQMIPQPSVTATPRLHVLPAGTELWRVHSGRRAGTEFKDEPADLHWGGGRFCYIRDELSTGPVLYLYAAMSPLAALCETLARDLRTREDGRRRIRQAQVRDRVLSKVEAAVDLCLVDLTDGPALAAVHQSHWLVTSEAPAYPRTRRWASWIRGQAGSAVGFRWPSRQEFGRNAADVCVLYLDEETRQHGPALLRPSSQAPLALDSRDGRRYVNDLLEPLRIRVQEPRSRK
ncbi:RES family NAD+ phosphorylase [Streptomyces sp. NPDC005799]|uniref:RES family NAD+ phosphorylase n=1 Tax=Streptomyces sp. NPDC005799 TaxID=3154678 RepID=UPI0033DD662A